MKKAGRIKKNHEFDRCYRRGKFTSGPGLTLYVFQKRRGERRVGFAVSRKIRGAVQRNRVKRVFREIYRLNQDALREKIDLIILGRDPALKGSYTRLTASFLQTAARAGILKSEAQGEESLSRQTALQTAVADSSQQASQQEGSVHAD